MRWRIRAATLAASIIGGKEYRAIMMRLLAFSEFLANQYSEDQLNLIVKDYIEYYGGLEA